MYNFSGIWYQMLVQSGIFLLIGIVYISLCMIGGKNIIIKDWIVGILMVVGAVSVIIYNGIGIVFTNISTYTGRFIKTNNSTRVDAPFTDQYVFWNGEGKKKVLYLDTYSKKKIFPDNFKTNGEYTVYFDAHTKIIVKVESTE